MRRSKRVTGQQTSRRRLVLESLEARRLLAAEVTGQLFLDSDPGGIQVYADANGNGVFDSGEPSTLTAPDGTYAIGNLPAGETIIRVAPIPVALNTGPLPPAPRLFMASGQVIQELSVIDGAVLDSFPARSDSTVGAEPMALAFDGTHVYMYDGVVHDVIVFDPDAPAGSSHVVDTIVVDDAYRFSGLAVLGSTLYGLSVSFGNPDLIVPIDLETQTVGTPIDVAAVNPGTSYELASGLGESADGTELVVSTTTQHRLNLDPETGLITQVTTGATVNSVSSGLAGAAGRLYAGRAAAFGIDVFDDNGSLLTVLPTSPIGNTFSGVASSLAAGPSGGNSILVNLQDNANRSNLDFFASNETATITGTQFVDANGNGLFDAGESPLPGVTVFVDFNGNQWPDAGEFQALTGSDGTYTITGVPIGTHLIRAVTDTRHRPIDSSPKTDRLFAIAPGANLGNNDFSMRIIELDLQTRSIISDFDTGLPISFASEVAFDGDRLIVFDDWKDRVYELTTDGQLIDSRPLGEPDPTGGGTFPVIDLGPSFVGDSVVSVRSLNQQLVLTEYDPVANEFIDRMPVQIDWQGQGTPPFEIPTTPNRFAPTLGRSPDGNGIVVYSFSDNRTLSIDIATGIGTFGTDDFSGNVFGTSVADYEAYESLGGRTYRSRAFGEIEIIDSAGTLLDTITTNFFAFGLGGGTDRDNVQTVTVSGDQTIDDVDMAWTSTLATLSGTVSGALSGTLSNTGNPGANPDQVYLDIDGDGQLGATEPSVFVNAEGQYVFTDVEPGDYQVRLVQRAEEVVRAAAPDSVQLFGYFIEEGTGKIAKFDPITGQQTTSFPAPGQPDQYSGLAARQGTLYFTQQQTLFLIDAETGATIDQIPIPQNVTPPGIVGHYSGVAVLGSSAYLYSPQTSVLVEFDLLSQQFQVGLNLSEINPGFPSSQDAGLGESPDGENLIVEFDGRIHSLDPQTGVINEVPFSFSETAGGSTMGTLAGVNGQVFVRGGSGTTMNRTIEVRDERGAITHRLLVGLPSFLGALAAEQTEAVSHRVSVYGEDVIADLDFERLPDTGSISGIQFVDANGNGVFDDDEQALAGAVVFVDTNANDWPDADEIQTVTDVDGNYTLSDVPVGEVLVRSLPPDSYRSTSTEEATDRLFAASLGPSTGPGRFELTLLELDPASGAVLSNAQTGVGVGNNFSIAFDGRHLIGIDNIHQEIYRFSTSGQLIDQRSLAEVSNAPAFPIEFHFGAVQIGNSTISVAKQGNNLHLSRYDAASNSLEVRLPVTYEWADQRLAQIYGGFIGPEYYFGGRAIGRDAIVMFHRFVPLTLTVDVQTGVGVIDEVSTTEPYRAIEAVGDFSFRSTGAPRLEVFDVENSRIETLSLPLSISDLAGGASQEAGIGVTVLPGQMSDGVDHAAVTTTSTLSGTVSGNGVDGRVVYVDVNNNGAADPGEPSATTNAGGDYVISGVERGEHRVRVVAPEGFAAAAIGKTAIGETAIEKTTTRLFIQSDRAVERTITEIDLVDGSVIRSFAAPHNDFQAGLALDGDRLYSIGGQRLYEIDSDSGAVLDAIPIPQGNYEGLAVIDSTAYFFDQVNYELRSFDLLTRRFGLSINVAQSNPFFNFFSVTGGLGESADGKRLLLSLSNGVYELDPTSGRLHERFGTVSHPAGAIAGAGDQVFINGRFSIADVNFISLFDENGFLRREVSVSVNGGIGGLAASTRQADFHRVDGFGNQSLTGFDFVLSPELNDITGTLYVDENANGIRDATESPLPDVIVFVDTNNNAWPDRSEIRTLSDAAGQYTLPQVPVSESFVRTLEPKAYRSTDILASTEVVFATRAISDAVFPFESFLQIVTINSVTGNSLSTTTTNIPISEIHTTAFDGRHLIVVDHDRRSIYQVTVDGELISETSYGTVHDPGDLSGPPLSIVGNAVIGGVVYMLGQSPTFLDSIFTFDTETNQFGAPKPLTLLHPPTGEDIPSYSFTLSESADGQAIIAFDRNEGVYTIDPATGRMTERRLVDGLGFSVPSATGVGGEVIVSSESPLSNTRVFDSQWNLVRQWPAESRFDGLGSGVFHDSGMMITVDANDPSSIGSIDFGFRSTLATVSGTAVTDTDGDGVTTVGDLPLAGATVYVDANRNGQFDDGEISVQTDPSGNYEIAGLPPGDHDIRMLVDADNKANTNSSQTRLFATDDGSTGLKMIRELDPITGEQIAAFPAPFSGPNFNTLALDEDGLHFGTFNRLWTLDPDTGEVLSFVEAPGTGLGTDLGQAVAEGETYQRGSFEIQVFDQNQFRTRSMPLNFRPVSVAAAVVPSVRHQFHAVRDSEFSNADFLISSGLEPTGIEMSESSINENIDTSIGDAVFAQLSAIDASAIDSHVFELVDGVGDDDNDRFKIDGNQLAIGQGEIVDYETQRSFLIRVRATDAAGTSVERVILIDVNDLAELGSVLINGESDSDNRSRITSLVVEFDGVVAADDDAFTITNTTLGTQVDYTFDPPSRIGGKTVFELRFASAQTDNGSLVNGNYDLRINAGKVHSTQSLPLDGNRDGIAGDDGWFGREASDRFFRLLGDSNGDRTVGLIDFASFRSTFGRSIVQDGFDASFDFDDSGGIGLADFASFRGGFGTRI